MTTAKPTERDLAQQIVDALRGNRKPSVGEWTNQWCVEVIYKILRDRHTTQPADAQLGPTDAEIREHSIETRCPKLGTTIYVDLEWFLTSA